MHSKFGLRFSRCGHQLRAHRHRPDGTVSDDLHCLRPRCDCPGWIPQPDGDDEDWYRAVANERGQNYVCPVCWCSVRVNDATAHSDWHRSLEASTTERERFERCSFCGERKPIHRGDGHGRLFGRDSVRICRECVDKCQEIMHEGDSP